MSREWNLTKRYDYVGGRVAYDVFGDGPPLVLIHGVPFWSYIWHKVVPLLSKKFTVYVHDFLGQGSSEKHPMQDVSTAAQTKIFCELLDHWELETPAVVGHDFGGTVALRAHLLEGRQYSRLILMDAVTFSPWDAPFGDWVKRYPDACRDLPDYVFRQISFVNSRRGFHKPMSELDLEPYLRPWFVRGGKDDYVRMESQYSKRYHEEIEHLYGKVSAPTLIAWGKEDEWLPASHAEKLHDKIPGSELRFIPAAGHFIAVDAPEEVASLIGKFVEAGSA